MTEYETFLLADHFINIIALGICSVIGFWIVGEAISIYKRNKKI